MKREETASSDNDYVFRYKMSDGTNREDKRCASRLDLLRMHLRNILDIAIPCNGDSEVRIDGFKLMNDRSRIHRVFDGDEGCPVESDSERRGNLMPTETIRYPDGDNGKSLEEENGDAWGCGFQSIRNTSLYEPTVEYIQRLLQSLLDLVELESHGKTVKVDAFRLKDLSQWVEESSCDPADMLGYLATRCNCNCVFCYNKGCPPSLALTNPSKSPDEEFKEVQTRLKYFYPEKKKNLFTSLGSSFEAFIHPHFREVLQEVRKKSDKLIRITTNGSTLTEEMIDYLLGFNPLHLDVALHSSSTHRRQRLMHDKTPEIAIKSLPLLRKAGIPYNTVIVPWPDGSPEEMLDDMERTIEYADENDAHLAEISLPGYSKYFSEDDLFDHDSIWEAIARKVRDIRSKYGIPIVIRPAM
jgi:DNA repair photolyase